MENIKEKNALVLAFVGDAYWTLLIREHLIQQNHAKAGKLHVMANDYICAKSQAKFFDIISPNLTETELSIAKRARNSYNHTTAKNCSIAEYKQATAFEAVIGYNYLCGSLSRVQEILEKIFTIEKSDDPRGSSIGGVL